MKKTIAYSTKHFFTLLLFFTICIRVTNIHASLENQTLTSKKGTTLSWEIIKEISNHLPLEETTNLLCTNSYLYSLPKNIFYLSSENKTKNDIFIKTICSAFLRHKSRYTNNLENLGITCRTDQKGNITTLYSNDNPICIIYKNMKVFNFKNFCTLYEKTINPNITTIFIPSERYLTEQSNIDCISFFENNISFDMYALNFFILHEQLYKETIYLDEYNNLKEIKIFYLIFFKLLIKQNANINARYEHFKNIHDNNVKYYKSYYTRILSELIRDNPDKYSTIQFLLEIGSNPNWQLSNGSTPLYIASQNNEFKIVKLLLKYGADPTIQKNNGLTPLAIALKNKNTKIVKLLHKYGAKE